MSFDFVFELRADFQAERVSSVACCGAVRRLWIGSRVVVVRADQKLRRAGRGELQRACVVGVPVQDGIAVLFFTVRDCGAGALADL